MKDEYFAIFNVLWSLILECDVYKNKKSPAWLGGTLIFEVILSQKKIPTRCTVSVDDNQVFSIDGNHI